MLAGGKAVNIAGLVTTAAMASKATESQRGPIGSPPRLGPSSQADRLPTALCWPSGDSSLPPA